MFRPFPILAELINQQAIDCHDVLLINMDEYLDDDGQWLPLEHPLSFRGFMNRCSISPVCASTTLGAVRERGRVMAKSPT